MVFCSFVTLFFFFSSRRRHTRFLNVTGVQTCALPISETRLGQATNFDSWKHAYAKRAENLAVSEVRALFSVVSRPEVVSLAGGMPDVSAMDNDAIRSAFDSLMSSRPQYALQYGGGQGDLRLREQICQIMELDGVHGSVEDLMITTGSQHALELI